MTIHKLPEHKLPEPAGGSQRASTFLTGLLSGSLPSAGPQVTGTESRPRFLSLPGANCRSGIGRLLSGICGGSLALLLTAVLAAQDPNPAERPPPLSQKEDRPKVEIAQKAGEPKELTFDDLVFAMEKGGQFERSMLTEKITQMNGERIRIRGFIRPAFKETGISKFVFVRDNQECCFGPGAALYDCILVELAGDKTTDYTVRPITVLGTLYLKEFKGPDGNIWAIYRMKNASVE